MNNLLPKLNTLFLALIASVLLWNAAKRSKSEFSVVASQSGPIYMVDHATNSLYTYDFEEEKFFPYQYEPDPKSPVKRR